MSMEPREFVFPEKSLEYAQIQHGGMKTNLRVCQVRSMLEWEAIQDYFSSETRTVLDLGCGVGRMSVWINWQLQNNAKFFLADRSIVSEDVTGGFPAKEEWYNDLAMTKLFATTNGLDNCETVDLVRREALLDLPPLDIMMSIAAVGYHWPIETWLDILEQMDIKTLIFTVRPGRYPTLPSPLKLIERIPLPSVQEDVIVARK